MQCVENAVRLRQVAWCWRTHGAAGSRHHLCLTKSHSSIAPASLSGRTVGPSQIGQRPQSPRPFVSLLESATVPHQAQLRPDRSSDARDLQPSGTDGGSRKGPDPEWTYHSALELHQPGRFAREQSWRESSRQQAIFELPTPPHLVRRLPPDLDPQLLTNAVLLVDKPIGWATDEVTRAVQAACKVRRLGHAGVLDCLSSGLVVLLLGEATRFTSGLNALPREHSGVIRLGLATDTRDAAGRGVEALPWRHVTDDDIADAAALCVGERLLMPPPQTASRVDHGQPTYVEKAPVMTARPAYIQQFRAWREPGSKDVQFRLSTTSGGSVVRSLAHEFGRLLGTCAHVRQMRREAVGWLRSDDAWTLDALLPLMKKTRGAVARRLRRQG